MASLATWSRMTWRHRWNSEPLPLTTCWLSHRLLKVPLDCSPHIVALEYNIRMQTGLKYFRSKPFRSCPGFRSPVTSPLFHLTGVLVHLRILRNKVITLDEAPLCKEGAGDEFYSLIRLTNFPCTQWNRLPCYSFPRQAMPYWSVCVYGFSLFLFKVYFYYIHPCMRMEIAHHTCRSRRTTYWSQFFPCAMWDPGFVLRL